MKKLKHIVTSNYLPDTEAYLLNSLGKRINLYNIAKNILALWGLFTIVWIILVYLLGE